MLDFYYLFAGPGWRRRRIAGKLTLLTDLHRELQHASTEGYCMTYTEYQPEASARVPLVTARQLLHPSLTLRVGMPIPFDLVEISEESRKLGKLRVHPRDRLPGVLGWQSIENLWDDGLKVRECRVVAAVEGATLL